MPGSPRISIVVPIYNVEPYLRACLDSLVTQSFEDFELIVVDDGSTDGSRAIAESYAARDPRFRIITQENGGLGKARNTGADAATGEFLAFVDSDDVVPRHAYKMLVESLLETGSDFATGNVHRLTKVGTAQSPFLADTFARSQKKTHVTRFRPLIADRIVPNKLWRRSFWTENGYRFPEGMLHEDIPVVVPAQFAARSVDIIAEPVYHYRIREGGDLSITQRRAEARALRDRMTAIEHVSRHLRKHGPRRAKRWYDESVVADDLRYYVNVLDSADEEYRQLFLERVNAFLDGAGGRIFRKLPAIQRLQWHLIRRRLMPELLEVLRFQREDIRTTPPVEERGRWYGDYPFRGDSRLKVPHSVYRLDEELWMEARLDGMRWDGERLELRGWAYVNGVGAATPDRQQVQLVAVRRGRAQRVRQRVSFVRLKTRPTERPDATGKSRQPLCDLRWSGFEATLDPRQLRTAGRWRDGTWEIYVVISAGREKRRTTRFFGEAHVPVQAVELPATSGDVAVKAAPALRGKVTLDVQRHWAAVRSARLEGDVLHLAGEGRIEPGAAPELEVVRRIDSRRFAHPMAVADGAFTAQIPLAELVAAGEPAVTMGPGDDALIWDLFAVDGTRRAALGLPGDEEQPGWRHGDGELALFRTRRNEAALIERLPGLLVTEAGWTEDGELELAGELPSRHVGATRILIAASDYAEHYAFPVESDTATGRFTARLSPARLRSLAGELPLRAGAWDLVSQPSGADGQQPAPVRLTPALLERLPIATVLGHKPFALGAGRASYAMLAVQNDLDDDERGPYNQRVLQANTYRAARREPLSDTVVFSSFGGRQYSDSPRAIDSELVRRGAPLDRVWVVRDAACEVPAGARTVREGSREHYDVLARARYVVANDHFPRWFARRDDQVCLQTWHGTPLKRLGLDVSAARKTVRRFQHRWDQQVANWQYVLSPNAFTTPILRRAYAVEGEMLETGYPRNDVLAAPSRDERSLAIRRQLGLPDDVRTVLYAPTYRDQVIDRAGRYRLDLQLDLDFLREAVGDDTVLLFRKHHYVADEVPTGPNGFVRDVSRYPDGTELMLAADILMTDYSSMMFDFANTGRPMLFFTYDLDAYQDEIRGFYLDFEDTVPGPLLRTTADVAGALRDIDGVRAAHAQRYEQFASRFCEFDDGRAAARVVDRIFSL